MATSLCRDALLVAACAVLAAAALRDVAVRTIPNTTCLALVGLALALRIAGGTWLVSVLAASAVFAIAVACWTRGWLGGGDVKLLAGAALLVSPPQVPTLLAAVALAGGVMSLAYLALGTVARPPAGQAPRGVAARVLRTERWRISQRGSLPYACAICAGAFATLLIG